MVKARAFVKYRKNLYSKNSKMLKNRQSSNGDDARF